MLVKSYISNIFLQEGVGGIYADKREENELNYVIPSVITKNSHSFHAYLKQDQTHIASVIKPFKWTVQGLSFKLILKEFLNIFLKQKHIFRTL